ncbi:outer membrane beta-barrel protein [Sphingobacterium sp. R2]|uniref:outer membrane beta-barrel protein n=1 Tax=unclassified Sphingobacterium TaxID=2609468 RepID=UPI00345DCFD9
MFDLESDINIYSIKADYRNPLTEKILISTGVKTNCTKTGNTAEYFFVTVGEYEPRL